MYNSVMTLNYLITKRKELNLSQKEVANHLNITQQHYSRIEKKNTYPPQSPFYKKEP